MVNDARFRQRIVVQILLEAFPIERRLLTAPIKPFQYHAFRQAAKLIQGRHIAAHTIVLVMTSQFSLKNRPPFPGFLVIPYSSQPVVHLLAFHTELLVAGLSKEDKLSLSILTTVVIKSKKIKGIGSAFLPACPFSFKPDYACLLWM